MRSKLLQHDTSHRTYVVVFDPGDEVVPLLTDFAREHHLHSTRVMGIGGFSRVILGYFDMNARAYKQIPVEEQVEVVSLMGNIALYENEPRVHAHALIGRSDGSAMGGHLLEATVQPTLELMLIETATPLQREKDAATGMPLLVP